MAKMMDKRALDFVMFQKEYLVRQDAALVGDVQSIYLAVCAWMVKMENLSPPLPLAELLELQSSMLIKGVLLAYQISHLLKTFLNMHMVR